MGTKLFALFLAFILALSSMTAIISAGSVVKSSKGGKKKGPSPAMSLINEVVDIFAAMLGDAFETAKDEFLHNLDMTMSVLSSLGDAKTIDSINFAIRHTVSSLSEAARKSMNENASSDTIANSDFAEFLAHFKTILINKCRANSKFSPQLLQHLESALPTVLEGLTEVYGNITDNIGFSLNFGMLNTGASMLTYLERPEYVSAETFKTFVDFPTEVTSHFEGMLNEMVSPQVLAQFNMYLPFIKGVVSNFKPHQTQESEEHGQEL